MGDVEFRGFGRRLLVVWQKWRPEADQEFVSNSGGDFQPAGCDCGDDDCDPGDRVRGFGFRG